jgi:ketosteroid isomerase-like protein
MNRRLTAIVLLVFAAACTLTREERIRREIRAAYDNLERAFAAMDVNAVIAARDPSIIVTGPDGQNQTYEQMADYSRRWFTTNKPPIKVRFTLRKYDIKNNDEVAVEVYQEAWRHQDLAGKRRLNYHNVVQTETWRRTPTGWKIIRVADVHDQRRWIDGKRVDLTKPYDPDAPEFVPPPGKP